ncbi:diguanylate cyclase [Dactylosporangium cerinum]
MDLPLLRFRRSIEWAGLISRSGSVLWVVCTVVLLPVPNTLTLWAAPLVLTNILAWYALRNVGHVSYTRISAVLVALDTATTIGAIMGTIRYTDVTLWPIFVIPIVVGAFRNQLTGALLTWLATSLSCVALYGWAEPIAGHPLPNELVSLAPALHLVVAVLLRQLGEARAELRHQALHDPLTGLGNRNLLEEFTRSGLTPGVPASVLVLDLDGFKAVNDTLGHAAGDELLRVVASRLRAHAREGDLVARLGGDEFVVDMRVARQAYPHSHVVVAGHPPRRVVLRDLADDAVAMATAVLAALAIVLAARLLTGAPTAAQRAVPVPARARSRQARPTRAMDPDAAGRPRPRAPGQR